MSMPRTSKAIFVVLLCWQGMACAAHNLYSAQHNNIYRFTSATNPETCDGIDNNKNQLVDEEQTGWPNFCDRSNLVDPSRYPLNKTQEIYIRAFETFWRKRGAQQVESWLKIAKSCTRGIYNLHQTFRSLHTMYRATHNPLYIERSVAIANEMEKLTERWSYKWANPAAPKSYRKWVDQTPDISYWNNSRCTDEPNGRSIQLFDLQGVRGISELAYLLKTNNDPRWEDFYRLAYHTVARYAHEGGEHPARKLHLAGTDKRIHFLLNALILNDTKSTAELVEWIEAVNKTLTSETFGYECGDSMLLKCYPPHKVLADKTLLIFNRLNIPHWLQPRPLDVSHANRDSELLQAWGLRSELLSPFEAPILLAVNTFLFSIWENNPNVEVFNKKRGELRVGYPNLFRDHVDGSLSCFRGQANYRWGDISNGWHELARYDARVLHLVINLGDKVIDNAIPRTLYSEQCNSTSSNFNVNGSGALFAEIALAYSRFHVANAISPAIRTVLDRQDRRQVTTMETTR